MSLAAKLKELRGKNRQSLQDVADAIGASKTHIYDLETGRSTNPSIELLTKLANHFRIAIADLVGENPQGADEEPGLVAMYRDLKSLSPEDRETIQVLMARLKPKGK
ncbi:helix-turn-helix transcriptional regulator [Rhizobium croatiense]|uniref:Helix-turn-helix domain-containing protein n=1 Tax=Rhizobium croatiense TaxID=2867516 RepID=A0ABS7M6E1_9HYPH|nr:helix-turn-helix transcriptional regulator [Rhizobium croatiense]MBY4632659.1 helix-turn-helix domain-containing protein [Rhizobium croatiense]